jgi:hypothetical protein
MKLHRWIGALCALGGITPDGLCDGVRPAEEFWFEPVRWESWQRAPQDRRLHARLTGLAYFPAGSDARRVLGEPAVAFGLSFSPDQLEDGWRFRPDLSFFSIQGRRSVEGGFNRLTAIPLKATFDRRFGAAEGGMQPYARFGVGVAYLDYRLDREDAPGVVNTYRGDRFALTASAEVGAILQERFRVYARYHYFPEVDRFDVSGLELGLAVSLFRF